MPIETGAPRSRGLLAELVRNGSGAVAPGSRDLPERVADPAPLPTWQRIALLAGLGGGATEPGLPERPEDEMLRRASRYIVLAPIGLRLLVIPAATTVVVGMYGTAHLVSLIVTAVVLAASDLATLLLAVGRSLDPRNPRLLGLGLLLAVAANLVVGASVPGHLYSLATAVTGAYLVGTVFLWTIARGGLLGAVPVLVNIPLQAVMTVLNHEHDPAGGGHLLAAAVGGTVGLIIALGAALLALTVLGLGARLAMAAGIRAGREDERAKLLRGLHDTVLQTLEVMALPQPAPDGADGELLRLRRLARGQAIEIRQALGQLTQPEGASRLTDDLATLAAAMATSGLRVQLALTDVDETRLRPDCRQALHDATREALRNVIKHAGVADAVLHLDEHEHEVVLIVRDHGC